MSDETKESIAIATIVCAVCFSVCFFMYGIYHIIKMPSKDEIMVEKGYVHIPVQDECSRQSNYIWVPSNSTEYKIYLSKLVEDKSR